MKNVVNVPPVSAHDAQHSPNCPANWRSVQICGKCFAANEQESSNANSESGSATFTFSLSLQKAVLSEIFPLCRSMLLRSCLTLEDWLILPSLEQDEQQLLLCSRHKYGSRVTTSEHVAGMLTSVLNTPGSSMHSVSEAHHSTFYVVKCCYLCFIFLPIPAQLSQHASPSPPNWRQ